MTDCNHQDCSIFYGIMGNYLQVLAAQIQVHAQQRAQIELDTRAFDLDMQLARALGGGYRQESISLTLR